MVRVAANTLPIVSLAGHRALLCGPTSSQPLRPPLVLLGGTAQWLDSWTGHLSALARRRRVLLYETRGQGGGLATPGTRQLDNADVGLSQHADDFWEIIQESGIAEEFAAEKESGVDVCAFSFGARVAMCAAASAETPPLRLRRLCLTGVSADRGARGRLALQSWRSSLRAGDLESFAWRLLLDTYSPATLAAQEANIKSWVRNVVSANSAEGLRGIVERTHTEDEEAATHPLAMARAMLETTHAPESVLLMNGVEDLLCAPGAGEALASAAGDKWTYRELKGAGHALPLEQPVAWRREVLDFLDGDAA